MNLLQGLIEKGDTVEFTNPLPVDAGKKFRVVYEYGVRAEVEEIGYPFALVPRCSVLKSDLKKA